VSHIENNYHLQTAYTNSIYKIGCALSIDLFIFTTSIYAKTKQYKIAKFVPYLSFEDS